MDPAHPTVRFVAGLALLGLASAAAGQAAVIKCVDADGNVTYQDSPCAGGQAGRSVELPKAEAIEDTSAWEAAAKDARIVRGMPKRWVLRARGAPLEIRPPQPREDATEVWRYSGRNGAVLVGFLAQNVAWVREDGVPASAAAAAPGAPAAAGARTKGAENRRFVIAGRYCENVFAEIGAADRQEALTVAPAVEGATATAAGVRYYYEPTEGDSQMRTVFSCIGGKVADVERTLVR